MHKYYAKSLHTNYGCFFFFLNNIFLFILWALNERHEFKIDNKNEEEKTETERKGSEEDIREMKIKEDEENGGDQLSINNYWYSVSQEYWYSDLTNEICMTLNDDKKVQRTINVWTFIPRATTIFERFEKC